MAMLVLILVAPVGCRCGDPHGEREAARSQILEGLEASQASKLLIPEMKMKPLVTITSLGGSVPVQAEGTLPDGKAFYFRARGTSWLFSVGATQDEAIEGAGWSWGELYGDRLFDAGYMSEDVARAIVESCADMYAAHVAPPVAEAGMSDAESTARRLARLLRTDILTYADIPDSGDSGELSRAITDIPSSGVLSRAVLTPKLAEAREVFDERVAPELRHVFDEEIGDLDALAHFAAPQPRWLLDAASARSVGARWAAMLRRLPAAQRAEAAARGDRWFPRWTADGAPRDALLHALREAPARN